MIQQTMENLETVDVLVAGGGMSGIMAALAAKNPDNSVLIVEASNVLGGQGTSGGVAGFCGDTKRVNNPFQDLVQRLSENNSIAEYHPNDDRRIYDLEWCAYFLQEMVMERNINVLLHSRVVDATAKNGVIRSVRITTAGEELHCKPGFVIDATGMNIIPVRAGFPVVNEGVNRQLPMSLYFTLWDTGEKVEPYLPPGYPEWTNEDEIPMTSLHFFPSGKVEVKMKVVGFDAADGLSLSRAEIFARKQMMALIYFLQTHGYQGEKLDSHVLASVSRSIGVREQRRIIGEYILTEEDVKHASVFEDGVAVGTYHLDYHWPDKMERAGTGITDMLEPYQIPLRAFIPKGAKNLLVPGRGASAEQMALSSFRVMATVAQMGFAAGKAAKQCVKNGTDVDGIDIDRLQEDIEKGGQSLNLSDYGEYLRQMLFSHETIFTDTKKFGECHASTIVQLRNSRYLVAWFGGTKEGSNDTRIWLSERYQTQWSEPKQIAKINDEPHWNPVLFQSPDRRVFLFFKVGADPTQWRTWFMESEDDGRSWSNPTSVNADSDRPVGPVKNKPIVLSDGTWLAPNSVESKSRWDAYVDISTDNGQSWTSSEFVPIEHGHIQGKGVIQPALWESKGGKVHMLLRSTTGSIWRSDSSDGGRTWSAAYETDLPNNNSGIDIAKLYDGTLALVYNPVGENWGPRTPLSVALSMDNGNTWPHQTDIETGEGEFSYPAVIPTQTGLAIVYTSKRSQIKFWHGSIEQILTDYDLNKLQAKLHSGMHEEL